MSFDLDIEIKDVDGNSHWVEVVCGHTYNLTPMWYKALPFLDSISNLNRMQCSDLIECLEKGFYDIEANRDEYRKLNPENGWGDFEGFREIFYRFLMMCKKYPSGYVEWSG